MQQEESTLSNNSQDQASKVININSEQTSTPNQESEINQEPVIDFDKQPFRFVTIQELKEPKWAQEQLGKGVPVRVLGRVKSFIDESAVSSVYSVIKSQNKRSSLAF